MATLVSFSLIVAGLILLTLGGECLVRGASALANALRISPLVIGLTVVAFGTSAPELAVTTVAAFSGETDVAVGNVVGSNICNVLLILGLSALISPLVVSSQLIRRDVPLMIAAALAMLLFALDGEFSRRDGIWLFGGLIAYTVWTIRASRRESAEVKEEYAEEFVQPRETSAGQILGNLLLIVGGLILLGLGSDWLVRGSVTLARFFGISELVIGLTIVAVGTSLPEAAASIIAAIRGERDIAVGNVVGSNLFNILSVLGISAVIAPDGIEVSSDAIQIDIPIMVAVMVACLPVFFSGATISRWNGAMFFGYYVAYLTYLVLRSTDAPITKHFEYALIFFVVPLTVIAILVGVVRSVKLTRQSTV
jgi:cation:H+ antiporter